MIPLRDTIPSRQVPLVTWALIFVNVLVFLFELTLSQEELEAFIHLFGIVPARYSHPDWAMAVGFPIDSYWPFVTSMFLHGGFMHVIGNMWSLWIFGDNVEERMGRSRFLIFYLLTGLIAGLTHYYTNIDSTIPTVGASGAIAGVLGAYLILFPKQRVTTLIPIFVFITIREIPAFFLLGFWFVLQLFTGAAVMGAHMNDVGGVAYFAHIGGFVAGMVLVILMGGQRPPPRPVWYADRH